MIDIKKITSEISERFKDHPDKNKIIGVVTGLIVKNTKIPTEFNLPSDAEIEKEFPGEVYDEGKNELVRVLELNRARQSGAKWMRNKAFIFITQFLVNKQNSDNKVLTAIQDYWKFDNNQQPISSWHDKQDLLSVVELLLNESGTPWVKLDPNNLPALNEDYLVQRPRQYSQIPGVDILIGHLHPANPTGQLCGQPGKYKTLYDPYWSFPGISQLSDVTYYIPIKNLYDIEYVKK